MLKRFFSFIFLLSTFYFLLSGLAFALTAEEQEVKWRAELEQTEKDIAKWQSILDSTKANTTSLQQEAAVLNAKIKQAQAFIKKRNIAIEQLGKEISKKTIYIGKLEKRIENGHESLTQLLRKENEIDEFSLPEVMLSNKNISDFFADIDSFQNVKKELQDLFAEIRNTKSLTEKEKTSLDKKKNDEIDTRKVVEAEKKQVEKNEKEKQYLITLNKTQEKTYEQVLAERQRRAVEIRTALFGLRDAVAIPFGTAYQYALDAKSATGIEPAFLLAVFAQESGTDSNGTFGKNTGSCYLKDSQTGTGVGANSGATIAKVMNPARDVPIFLTLMSTLGYSPYATKVSCPQSIGWGGAMGPAQFIPSTWNLFSSRVANAVGIKNPDPWSPRAAFMAAALYLTDLGGGGTSYSGQKNAACRYYSGSKCSSSKYANSYGNSVLKKAEDIQTNMIDPLNV